MSTGLRGRDAQDVERHEGGHEEDVELAGRALVDGGNLLLRQTAEDLGHLRREVSIDAVRLEILHHIVMRHRHLVVFHEGSRHLVLSTFDSDVQGVSKGLG